MNANSYKHPFWVEDYTISHDEMKTTVVVLERIVIVWKIIVTVRENDFVLFVENDYCNEGWL